MHYVLGTRPLKVGGNGVEKFEVPHIPLFLVSGSLKSDHLLLL